MQQNACDIVLLSILIVFAKMDNNTRFVISRNIRHRRLYLGLTQGRVAAAVNYSNVWLSHIENGRGSVPAECMPAIAQTLKTTITDLYKPGRFYGEE